MSATNAFETELLSLLFENAAIANFGIAAGILATATDGDFYISLHTTPGPADAGDQTTNEASYTGYARKQVVRGTGTWTATGNSVSNDAAITFAECTAGSATVTHFGIGSDVSGTGNLWFWGALDSSLAISSGIIPEFAATTLAITLD